jgi:hypothetical protein
MISRTTERQKITVQEQDKNTEIELDKSVFRSSVGCSVEDFWM